MEEWATQGRFKRARHLELIEYELMQTLHGDTDILVVQAPPRHGKSWYLSRAFPKWFHSVYPYKRSILTSYGLDLLRPNSKYVRDGVHELAEVYGNGGVSKALAAATDWEMANGVGGMVARGVGGGITGRGADILMIDDYIKNAEEAVSQDIRDAQWEWFQTTAFTRVEPGGKLVVLATRWFEDDLIGRILKWALEEQSEYSLKVREIRLPALAEPTEAMPDPLGRKTDEPLWPERLNRRYLEQRRRALDPYWWNAIYQQRLGSYGSNEWPTEYFYGIFAQDDEWPESFAFSATALDPSKGKNARKGDFAAIVNVGYKGGYLWVEADIERRPVPKMCRDLVVFNERVRPTVTGIEAASFQDLIAPDYIQAQTELGVYRDDPELVDNTISKVIRISRLGLWLRLHRIKIKRNAAGMLLVEQLRNFPNAKHDDGPDALEMAIRLLLQVCEELAVFADLPSDAPTRWTV